MPQSISNVLIHVVYSTKDRKPLLSPETRNELYPYTVGILRKLGCPVLQIGGVDDHMHLLISLARTVPISQMVEKAKSNSSRWLKSKNLPDFAWQAGYGAFSVSPTDSDAVIAYIRGQEAHHRKISFQDEMRELFREAGVAFDERYLWD